MSTEQGRADFEKWFLDQKRAKYPYANLDIAWGAWQASRAELVVPLPSAEGFSIYSKETAQVAIDCCAEAILSVGIAVREG
ncbi:hypothetical protein SOASR014_40430 [Pectobacterium carotovorum subsp. carotovorum]|nr:hypothetical protein SOASR014_40430 [Pectobacterium carotovorum subsp. carotovorum]GLX46423.1 hypothetical protein Pcaca01_40910 [Pectobacterium carotovorum subsp. carotovorum]